MTSLRGPLIWQVAFVVLFVVGLLLDEPLVADLLPVLVFLAIGYVLLRFMMVPLGDLTMNDALFPPAVMVAVAGAIAIAIAPPPWFDRITHKLDAMINERSTVIDGGSEVQDADIQPNIPDSTVLPQPQQSEPQQTETLLAPEDTEVIGEIATLTPEKSAIEEALEASERARQAAEQEAAAFGERLAEAEAALAEASRRSDLASTKEERELEASESPSSAADLALLREQLNVAELSLAAAQEKAAGADRLQADIDRLEQDRRAAETAAAEGAAALAEAETDLEASRSALGERDADLTALRADLETRRDAEETLRAQIRDLETEVGERENRFGLIREERKALYDRLGVAEEETGALTDQNASLQRQIDDLANERDRLAGTLDSALSGTDETKAAVSRLETDLQRMTTERSALETLLQTTREEATDHAATAERFRQRSEALQGEVMRFASILSASEREATRRQAVGGGAREAATAPVDEPLGLKRLRSTFFGRLENAFGGQTGAALVGDRFVLEAALLFEPGSAEAGAEGIVQLDRLAMALKDVIAEHAPDTDWRLRIDGFADEVPVQTVAFASNWELASARAVSIVEFLIDHGIPSELLSASAFGEYHPIEDRGGLEAGRQHGRIELAIAGRRQ